jgi:hypothetical protein
MKAKVQSAASLGVEGQVEEEQVEQEAAQSVGAPSKSDKSDKSDKVKQGECVPTIEELLGKVEDYMPADEQVLPVASRHRDTHKHTNAHAFTTCPRNRDTHKHTNAHAPTPQ